MTVPAAPMPIELSYFVGETGALRDPSEWGRRLKARSMLWEELERLGVDAPTFDNWLARRLADLFAGMRMVTALAAPAEQADELQFLSRLAGALSGRLHPEGLPLRARIMLSSEADSLEVPWHVLRERLSFDLIRLQALADAAEKRVRGEAGKSGRKARFGEDQLLKAVVDKLKKHKLKRAVSGPLALRLLEAEGVSCPSSDQKDPERGAARAAGRASRLPK